jgi:hypothetical protein
MDGAGAGRVLLFWLRLAGLALLPTVLARFSPSMGMGLGLLTPIPLAYGMFRRGVLEGVLAVSVVALGTMFALGSGEAFFFLLQTVPLVIGISWALTSRLPSYLPVLGGVALVAFAALAGLLLVSAVTGTAMDKLWWETADPFGFLTQPPPAAPAGQPEAAQLREQMVWFMDLWRRLFAGLWVASLILLFLFYTVVTRGVLIQREDIPPVGNSFLAGWRLPWPFVGAFIVLGFAVAFGAGPLRSAAANAMVPLGTLYGIQGMVVTGHVFFAWRIPAVVRFLGFFLLALWNPMVLIVGLALAGILDTWFDFRRRVRPSAAPPPSV